MALTPQHAFQRCTRRSRNRTTSFKLESPLFHDSADLFPVQSTLSHLNGSGPKRTRRSRSGGRWLLLVLLGLCCSILLSSEARDAGGDHFVSFMYPKSYAVNAQPGPMASKDVILHDLTIISFFACAGYVVSYFQQRFVCAPHIEVYSPPPPPPVLGAMLAAGLYGANIAYNVLNKRLLIAHPHPIMATTLNLGTCSICCFICWISGFQEFPQKVLSRRKVAKLLPLALLHWAGMLFSNIAVAEVNISFTHTVKAAEPLFTALFSIALLGEHPSLMDWLSLLLVIAGVAVASTAEGAFTWYGFWAAMASNVSVSFRTVLSKRMITLSKHDPLNFMAFLQCGAFLISLPFAFYLDADKLLPIVSSMKETPVMLFIGPLVWVFNISSILILSRTSPVVHSMIRTLRRPLLVFASIVAFGTAVTPINGIGILVALFGAWLYQTHPFSAGKAARQLSGVHLLPVDHRMSIGP